MLSDMDGETTFARRRALCKTAVGVAARLEIGVVKHLNTLLTVSLAYASSLPDSSSTGARGARGARTQVVAYAHSSVLPPRQVPG